jgi:hypothetical protein
VSIPPVDGRDAQASEPAAGQMSLAALVAGSRSGDVQMSRQAGVTCIVVFGVALPLGTYAYLFVPYSVTRGYCPPTTFLCEHMGPVGPLVGGLFLVIACFTALTTYIVMKFPGSPPSPRLLAVRASKWFNFVGLIAPLCGLCISGMLWVDSTGSFYCAMPDRVLLHPFLTGPWRSLTWDDVTLVQASCYRNRRRHSSDYTLSSAVRVTFADGEQIVSGWATGDFFRTMSYGGIRAALAQKSYRYVTDHVSPDFCPPDAYPLLLNWQN